MVTINGFYLKAKVLGPSDLKKKCVIKGTIPYTNSTMVSHALTFKSNNDNSNTCIINNSLVTY